jgi:hypothetical protein
MTPATFKLTSNKFDDLRQHFDVSRKVQSIDNIMTAILECRLVFRMISYLSLVEELVASHMMVLLRVSKDLRQIEGTYSSELRRPPPSKPITDG